jgi:hypothetical protein
MLISNVASRGSIWTVPSVGLDACCLVISEPRGLARGRPEYQIVVLYAEGNRSSHTAADFRIKPSETTLGVALIAALWNVRPILGNDLGGRLGEVRDVAAVDQIRDAYLRLADPRIFVPETRVGMGSETDHVRAFREAELTRWHPTTGRALASKSSSAIGGGGGGPAGMLTVAGGYAYQLQQADTGYSTQGVVVAVSGYVVAAGANAGAWSVYDPTRLAVYVPNTVAPVDPAQLTIHGYVQLYSHESAKPLYGPMAPHNDWQTVTIDDSSGGDSHRAMPIPDDVLVEAA